jgi:hypothetical protein
MQYILQNDKWQITYIDSKGTTKTFFHPTYLCNSLNDLNITEQKIREVFPTDEFTENYINYMEKYDIIFDDGSKPYLTS